NESPVAEGDDLGSIFKVEPDRRAGFACPPQEETRSAIAFHLWRESGSFYNRFARGTAEEVRGLEKIFTEGHEGKRRGKRDF
ncbi:MAG: hypothetical protein WCG03_09875, partial [Kiritimatiellales bacterium]